MEITHHSKQLQKVIDIRPGQGFSYEGHVYMRLFQESQRDPIAVNLKTGSTTHFTDNALVEYVQLTCVVGSPS